MGSHLNFRNFGATSPGEGSDAKPSGNPLLARQSSVYSLTFDEFQSNWGGGLGKDFGSLNMDELLKNICTAEETQAMTNSIGVGEGSIPGGTLQRQGSLTLPRTLSQKTVDEVWRHLTKEGSTDTKDGSEAVGSNLPQRQQTLGEMTLEEFLARAGVVREDAQQFGRINNAEFFGELSRLSDSSNAGLVLGFQQLNQNGVLGTQTMENSNKLAPNQPPNIALNVGGIRSSSQLLPQQHLHQHQAQQREPQPQPQPPLFPKPASVSFASPMHLANGAQLSSPRGSVVGLHTSMNNTLVQGGGMSMIGLGSTAVTVAAKSPTNQVSPDMIAKRDADESSPSPVPNVFGRGRKANAALEKVVERRQRRMIKNRESAARSRARKQAYTMELEAEVAKLKELNKELQKKQAETEMQNNRFPETMNLPWASKRQCLRRTLTGPW